MAKEAWSATDDYTLLYPYKGKFVIVSNSQFAASTHLDPRPGTDVDTDRLRIKFTDLGFDVYVYENQTAFQMQTLFQQLGNENHGRYASFGCAIMTHGRDGVVFGTDGLALDVNAILKPFFGDRCDSLVGQPKFFIIEACCGPNLMDSTPVHSVKSHNASRNAYDVCERIPVESDFLIAYAVVPGFAACRHPHEGSWFVQAICSCLEKYARSLDLVQILTLVNKKVALFENNSTAIMHGKQLPCITSMLTKDFFLQ